ncbi:hypothetical protein [Chitinophaga arvensicola]|uniref:Uncharacterized protein n=1 Tax=Chitinophaga arvensicola TaxID=29529 RepID=A0A1I0S8I7_9BACT|nr:hypothetical protein [Chitinophaga arvensicola]SEW52198.1 hypothetical protein SAMN04488122_4719 [Chitinophaga arvensicola]
MRVAIFFACLCFLLLRGDSYAFTGTPHHNTYHTSPKFTENEQHVTSGDNTSDDASFSASDGDDDDETLISDDVVEEDNSSFLVRKYKLVARFHWALSHLFIADYLSRCFKAPPPFSGLPAYIYITQGVLRI